MRLRSKKSYRIIHRTQFICHAAPEAFDANEVSIWAQSQLQNAYLRLLKWQVSLSLNNLAALLRKMEKLPQAEELYRKALAIREDTLGQENPQVCILVWTV